MKIGGVEVTAPPVEGPLVFPRGEKCIAFWGQAVPDMEEFDRLCPVPAPPGKHVPNKGFVPDLEDPGWKEMIRNRNSKRSAYIIIKTLEPSCIEWDTVDLANPKTWLKWEDDLRNNGFTEFEVQKIIDFVTDTNGLNEAKLEKAREVFLLGRVPAQNDISSPSSEQANTPSGEPVSASA